MVRSPKSKSLRASVDLAFEQLSASIDVSQHQVPAERVAGAYTVDSVWRNRSVFLVGRDQIREFLASKWGRELDYRLVKALWAFTQDRIAVRFRYEWHDAIGNWFRSYGNELWEFDDRGLMRRREASINDVAIGETERTFFWPAPGSRPSDHPGIPDVK